MFVAFSHVFYARWFDTWLSIEVEQYLAIVRVPVTECEREVVKGWEGESERHQCDFSLNKFVFT